ncbi:MAG: hypothetical protein LBV19_10825, partial [Streptococcaceae bacterium]|nr:hypothetical protein [Streptococcaceae bacterium]
MHGGKSASKTFAKTFKSNAKISKDSLLPKFTPGYTTQKAKDVVSVYTKETIKKVTVKELDKATKPIISKNIATPIANKLAPKGSLENELFKQGIEMKGRPASIFNKIGAKVNTLNKSVDNMIKTGPY